MFPISNVISLSRRSGCGFGIINSANIKMKECSNISYSVCCGSHFSVGIQIHLLIISRVQELQFVPHLTC